LRLKLVNNTMVAFAAEGVATSVVLARRLGLETEFAALAGLADEWSRPWIRGGWVRT
jgi:3-hydroxyisobutyrate dehydrogenase-like beta-hydroxyacid dehydrogenase